MRHLPPVAKEDIDRVKGKRKNIVLNIKKGSLKDYQTIVEEYTIPKFSQYLNI